jgi:hypothetical protein
MKYEITKKELICINVLIKTITVSIERNTFSEDEKNNIYKTIEILTQRQKK